ncbi:MAG TPA: hypothetical protein VF691_12970 [Cytophagaceae bacterium]
MKSKIFFILSCLFIFIDGCKVHPKNSEPAVRLYFFAGKTHTNSFCFDNVQNKKDKNWSACIDSINNYIDIPLDLNENSCSLIFSKNKKSDTLEMSYTIKMEQYEGELDAKVSDFKISKSSFDSISAVHKPSKLINTNVTESISIYY